MEIRPFRVEAGTDAIEDLRLRLSRTRWPDALPGAGWSYGADLSYVQELCGSWAEGYNWKGYENRFNIVPQFLTEIDGQRVHFHHARSPEPNAKPLILCHGWPSSTAEFLDVIGPLYDPRSFGG